MGTRDDSLASVEGPDRVHYATGVLLDAEDFRAEQDYHRGRLARALAYVAGSGTVAGLKVIHEPAIEPVPESDDPVESSGREERLLVEPGLAIDRLGRMIEVPRPLCIRLNRWYETEPAQSLNDGWHGDPINGVVVDLFIRFAGCSTIVDNDQLKRMGADRKSCVNRDKGITGRNRAASFKPRHEDLSIRLGTLAPRIKDRIA